MFFFSSGRGVFGLSEVYAVLKDMVFELFTSDKRVHFDHIGLRYRVCFHCGLAFSTLFARTRFSPVIIHKFVARLKCLLSRGLFLLCCSHILAFTNFIQYKFTVVYSKSVNLIGYITVDYLLIVNSYASVHIAHHV